jgi:hypothetical protein
LTQSWKWMLSVSTKSNHMGYSSDQSACIKNQKKGPLRPDSTSSDLLTFFRIISYSKKTIIPYYCPNDIPLHS